MDTPVAGGTWKPASSPWLDAVRLALDWNLVDAADVVDGDLRVSSSARRNLNLRIERRRRRGYLVKTPDLAAAAAETVATEARFYELCSREPSAAAVASIMPPFVACREPGPSLVLELVRDARTTWEAYREHGPPELPLAPARELGRSLAVLHGTFEIGSGPAPPPPGLRDSPPPYFGFHEPHPEMLRSASPARLELCRLLQQEPAVAIGLGAARALWRVETVIHGDVRSDNVLVAGPPDEPRQVLLVDWELVQVGDPAWDLAGALEDHVRFWLHGMSPQPNLSSSERSATALWPLPAVQTAILSFYLGYAEASGRSRAELAPRFSRAVPLSAARMLQTAWEHCRHLERVSSFAILLVQAAVNVLTDPERAASELYALDEVLEA